MKKVAILILAFSFAVIGGAGSSFALTIVDDYIGAEPTGTDWDGEDIIGAEDSFSITSMDVNIVGTKFEVKIYSTYFDNIGKYDTELGDLFISTNGWNPVTPTENDNFFSPGSEDWELAIALDDHMATSGSVALYAVDETKIVLSSAPSGYIYREGQEVQYDGDRADALGAGSWEISADETFLTISIEAAGLGWDLNDLNSLGFHYTMTCANDVIEGGSSPVPEPGTVFLMGAGLIGMGILGRRRNLSN